MINLGALRKWEIINDVIMRVVEVSHSLSHKDMGEAVIVRKQRHAGAPDVINLGDWTVGGMAILWDVEVVESSVITKLIVGLGVYASIRAKKNVVFK